MGRVTTMFPSIVPTSSRYMHRAVQFQLSQFSSRTTSLSHVSQAHGKDFAIDEMNHGVYLVLANTWPWKLT